MFAREVGHRCGPVHLLVGVADGNGPAAAALDTGQRRPLRAVVRGAGGTFGDGAGFQHMQAQAAARALAADLGSPPAPGHLLIALLDQGAPEVLRALTLAGLDPADIRLAALSAVGAPAGLPPLALPPPTPAGTMDRPALPESELDERAWQALRWRQDHLPLGAIRRRGDLEALSNLEQRAALRIADRLSLDDDQRYSLLSRHSAEVSRRAAAARPGLGPRSRRTPMRRRRSRAARLTVGWGTWFGNRWVSLRDRWFRLRTAGSYRGAPRV